MRGWWHRLSGVLRKARPDSDLSAELDAHLLAHIDDNISGGMSEADARRHALLALGGVAQTQESVRDRRSLPSVETTMQDLRYAARMLLKTPGFSMVAIATLALGIGANTAIFSVINAVLIERLPFKDPERLVAVWEQNARRPAFANPVSPVNYLRWRERADGFESFGAFLGIRSNLTAAPVPLELSNHIVTQGFFETLGVTPLFGRTFSNEESTRPGAAVIVMSHALWITRFGKDPTIVGRSIQLDGRAVAVIGIMPPDARLVYRNGNGTKPPDVWSPFVLTSDVQRGRFLSVVGRLKPGVSIAQARAQMAAIADGYSADFPNLKAGWTTKVVPLRDELAGEVKPALLVLAGAVTFVLLIACVNVANLLLARGARRQHEIAVRTAIGAGRARVVRQLLTETLLLCVLGGLAGLAVAQWTLQALLALSPIDISGIGHVRLSYPVLLYTALVSIVTAVFAGFAPAFESSRADLSALKNGIRQTGPDVRRRRLRQALVVAELSLAVVLLLGAGLMLRSFANLQRIDTGFDAHNVLTMRMTLPLQRYNAQGSTTRFYEAVTRKIQSLPGVQSAGVVSFLPFADLGAATDFTIEGRPHPSAGHSFGTAVRVCDQGYFDSMHIALRRGRWFTDREQRERANVVIVNESLARLYFQGQDPIGQRITISMNEPIVPTEIVGVVADVKYGDLAGAGAGPTSYWPHPQLPYNAMTLTVRTTSSPLALAAAVEREIQTVDKDQPVSDVRTMEQWMERAVSRERFSSTLLAAFATLALLLAAIGIYGVMSYAVSQRQSEIGVRLALGATARGVQWMMLGSGLKLVAAGLAIGLIAGVAVSRLLGGLLYHTSTGDPFTIASTVAVLGVVATLAIYLPARRASKLSPIVALQAD